MATGLLILAAGYAVLFALCGAAVRIQWALFRGFDLICAVAVLSAAEIFNWLSRRGAGGEPTLVLATAVAGALGSAIIIVVLWNMILDRVFRETRELSAGLLILSLGISTAATGFVILVRGPGLRQPTGAVPAMIGSPAAYAIFAGVPVLIAVFAWTWNKTGFALNLWAQDPSFAREIGIGRGQLAVSSGIVGGACLGVAGSYFVIVGGSTPEIGLPAFLYGVASALLLPGNTINRSVLGGLVLGPLFVALQFIVAPAISNSILFILALGLLLYRGTSRTVQQVR